MIDIRIDTDSTDSRDWIEEQKNSETEEQKKKGVEERKNREREEQENK